MCAYKVIYGIDATPFKYDYTIFRWMIRTAYGIHGDAPNDFFNALFCPCCSANQLYQTAKARGNPTSNGGNHLNVHQFQTKFGSGDAHSCLYSCFCMPCAVGTMLEDSIGMPWYMGCCCVNVPTARNLIRYQYRIYGKDTLEECVFPWSMYCFGKCVDRCFPPIWLVLYGLLVPFAMQLLQEVHVRKVASSSPPSGYLTNNFVPNVAVVTPNYNMANAVIAAGPHQQIYSPIAVQSYGYEMSPPQQYMAGPGPYYAHQQQQQQQQIIGIPVTMQSKQI